MLTAEHGRLTSYCVLLSRRVLCSSCRSECTVSMSRVKKELYPDDKEAIDALPRTIKHRWHDLVLKEDVAALHGVSWEEFLKGSSSRKTKM